jgi:hypothetical protein
MIMSKTQVINLHNLPDKWLKLMLHIQNSVPNVFQLTFPDDKTARTAGNRMNMVMSRHPSWFNLMVCQRGCEVYVAKINNVQKVVIKDEE